MVGGAAKGFSPGLAGVGELRKTVRGAWGTLYSFDAGVFGGDDTIHDCCKLEEFVVAKDLFEVSVPANVAGTWKNVPELG